jgi:phosphohistidine swiveling domain-containing protein
LGASTPPTADLTALVQTRRTELTRCAALAPPAAIGRLPLLPAPNDPFTRTLAKLLGQSPVPAVADLREGREPPQHTAANAICIQGHAASRGVVRGRAKVIHTLAEANQLQAGDILVTEATMPPWTPYFTVVAAIVTDTGGILCHAAVVAREVGIPAVVGTRIGTVMIRDGQLVEVDGSAGVVQVVDGLSS